LISRKPETVFNIWDKIKSIFSNLNPFTAQVSNIPFLPSEQEEIVQLQERIKELEKEREMLENKSIKEKSEELGVSEEQLREFMEDLDKISEEMNKLNEKMTDLRKKQNEEEKNKEEKEEEQEEEEQQPEELSQSVPKILISEVCAGLDKSQNEFIELYNPNNSDIDLDKENFKLKLVNSGNNVTEKQISWNKNIILAKGYFLLVGGKLRY